VVRRNVGKLEIDEYNKNKRVLSEADIIIVYDHADTVNIILDLGTWDGWVREIFTSSVCTTTKSKRAE